MLGRRLFSSGLALGLVLSICFPAHAEILKNLKTDGSIEVRSFGIDNETDRNGTRDDYRSEVHTRVMVGGTFDLLDDVHGRVLLRKNNRIYGGSTAGDAVAPGNRSEDLNTVQSNIFVDNAYTKIDKVFGHVDMTMGRQFYGNSDDLVIYFGPQNDDLLNVTALDAFRADADLGGWVRFQGIAGKLADTGATGALANTDTDLWGGQVMTDKVPAVNLAAYYYTRQVKSTKVAPATGNNTLQVLGFRGNGDIAIVGGLGYNLEYVQNFGRNNSGTGPVGNANPAYDGNAWIAGLHYGHDFSMTPLRAHIELARGSRDFASIAAGKRFGLIWGEHSTVGPSTLNGVGGAGVTNLKVLDGGIGVSPLPKLGLDLNAYRFMYSVGPAGKTSAGTEYDLIVSWKHSDNVWLEANAATFQVGDANQNAAPTATSPITRLGADVKIKF